ncbi:MAG: hypothetical protein AVDCRST_MAG08-1730, partial [uncultured Acetobacteraceae bacterium]
ATARPHAHARHRPRPPRPGRHRRGGAAHRGAARPRPRRADRGVGGTPALVARGAGGRRLRAHPPSGVALRRSGRRRGRRAARARGAGRRGGRLPEGQAPGDRHLGAVCPPLAAPLGCVRQGAAGRSAV